MPSICEVHQFPRVTRDYACHRCETFVTICTSCDRGNIYCKDCSPIARSESCRKADRRYRSTALGKERRVAQLKRYRVRLANPPMGDQGSHADSTQLLSEQEPIPARKKQRNLDEESILHRADPKVPGSAGVFCHFCKKSCSSFKRDPRVSWSNQKKAFSRARSLSRSNGAER